VLSERTMKSLLKEVNRKRKAVKEAQKAKTSSGNDIEGLNLKYSRQSDLHRAAEFLEEEDYVEDGGHMEAQNLRSLEVENSIRSEPHSSVKVNVSNGDSMDKNAGGNMTLWDTVSELSLLELHMKFREHSEPITLFGEQAEDKKKRLMKVMMTVLNQAGTKTSGPTLKSTETLEIGDKRKKLINVDDEESDGEDGAVEGQKGERLVLRDMERFSDYVEVLKEEMVVYRYFKRQMNAWESALHAKDTQYMESAAGRKEKQTLLQCKDHIAHLFRLCKQESKEKGTIPADLLGYLVKMVTCCEEGNFRQANDHYLQAAIGNAAWPIGVTSVGIHERSAREKISTSKMISQPAHIMNNEMQRKYLTSVKRLMTFASSRPDVDPSMKA
jgi:pre-mRNA-splicing factor 18